MESTAKVILVIPQPVVVVPLGEFRALRRKKVYHQGLDLTATNPQKEGIPMLFPQGYQRITSLPDPRNVTAGGNQMIIKVLDMYLLLAHLHEIPPTDNSVILMGNTGTHTSGQHLHIEMNRNKDAYNLTYPRDEQGVRIGHLSPREHLLVCSPTMYAEMQLHNERNILSQASSWVVSSAATSTAALKRLCDLLANALERMELL